MLARSSVQNVSCFRDFPACPEACGAAHWLREDLWFGQGALGCQRCLKMKQMLFSVLALTTSAQGKGGHERKDADPPS